MCQVCGNFFSSLTHINIEVILFKGFYWSSNMALFLCKTFFKFHILCVYFFICCFLQMLILNIPVSWTVITAEFWGSHILSNKHNLHNVNGATGVHFLPSHTLTTINNSSKSDGLIASPYHWYNLKRLTYLLQNHWLKLWHVLLLQFVTLLTVNDFTNQSANCTCVIFIIHRNNSNLR